MTTGTARTGRLPSAKNLTLNRWWTSSFTGQPIAFVDQFILFYAVDDGLRFHEFTTVETQKSFTISANGLGVGVIAGNPDAHVYAFSDLQPSPSIHIREYPSLTELTTLSGAAEFEYSALEFSTTDELLSLSVGPDYLLTVWDWKKGVKLAQKETAQKEIIEVSFNPNSWHDIAILYKDQINLYTCERRDDKYTLSERVLPLELFNQTVSYTQQSSSSKTNPQNRISELIRLYPSRFSYTLMDNTISADKASSITLVAFDTENEEALQTYMDVRENLIATSFCWGDKGFIYIGTADNSLIQVILQFDREKILSRTTRFAEEEGNVEMCMFKKIRLHKLGLFAAGTDDVVRLVTFDNQEDSLQEANGVSDLMQLDGKLTHINFNLSCTLLFVSSLQGLDILDLSTMASRSPLVPVSIGKIIDVAILNPLNEYVITIRETGTVEAWSMTDGLRSFFTQIPNQVSHIVASPLLPLIIVTSVTGQFYFLAVIENNFRLLHSMRIHSSDIKCIKFNSNGNLLVSAGTDNSLFLLEITVDNAHSGEEMFHVLNRTELEGEPFAVELEDFELHRAAHEDVSHNFDDLGGTAVTRLYQTRVVVAMTTKADKYGRLLVLDLDWQFNRDAYGRVTTRQTTMSSDNGNNEQRTEKLYSNKVYFGLHETIDDLLLITKNQILTVAGKLLRMCRIPEETRQLNKLVAIEPQDIVQTLPSTGGHLYKSNALPSCAIAISRDGILSVIHLSDLSIQSVFNVHTPLSGGCHKSIWSLDSKFIVSISEDSTIVAFQCKHHGKLDQRFSLSSDEYRSKIQHLKDTRTYENEPTSLFKQINQKYESYQEKFRQVGITPPTAPEPDLSWIQLKEYEATLRDFDQHLRTKVDIRRELDAIRAELGQLISINDGREEKARLDRRDFDLDVEEQDRQKKERDVKITKIREETLMQNLQKLMQREVIKQQCWDSMSVKGRCIEGFYSGLQVENYPLVLRTLEEQESIRQTIERRRIEIAEKKLRRQILNDEFILQETGELPTHNDHISREINYENEEEVKESEKQSIALLGSVSNEFNVDTSVLYSQFELYTIEQKWTQIALIQDLIYKLKEAFNREFEEVHQKKLQELAKIRERNTRIKQINYDIDDKTQVWEPDLSEKENPNLLFDVKENEVNVERYYTPEQLKQLEEQRLAEERRRELEKSDNWRERGLQEMMGGVLQVRREDELKKEVPKPAFAIEKAEEDWTELERQQYQLYLQKVKEIQEEREKLRKVLTAELTKINEQIKENCLGFEQILQQLHRRKLLAQTAILQEELKISRIAYSLVKDRFIEQLEEKYVERARILQEKLNELEVSKLALEMAAGIVEQERKRLKQDDSFERMFPREFADVPSALQEALKRQLTKKPKLKQVTKPVGEFNPYSAHQTRSIEIELEKLQLEADSFTNAPANIVKDVWERFVEYRRKKLDLEKEIRQQEQEEIIIKNLKNAREGEMIRKTQEIEQIRNLSNTTIDSRVDDLIDLYVQVVLKQGQIEIESPPPDVPPDQYRCNDCELIHRREVEDLNKLIIESANLKIKQMEKSKRVCNDLYAMEWDKKKLNYEITDLKQRAQDITFLKVTRNIQEYLACADDTAFDLKNQREIQMFENTIEKMKQRFEEQQIIKDSEVQRLQRDNLGIANTTLAVDEALQNANVNLYERKNIIDDRIVEQSKTSQNDRMKQIVRRRRLVDLAKAQAQEVAYLRAEVERLRMKTFPALVQIEH